jgi:FKBP-type peptidyl-prolyl cis-trans isomerase FklB
MKNILSLVLLVSLAAGLQAQNKNSSRTKSAASPKGKPAAAQPAAPQTKTEKLSYAIGINLARNFMSNGIEINSEMLALAVRAVFENQPVALTEEEGRKVLAEFEDEMKAKMQKQQAAQLSDEDRAKLAANKARGKSWLEENKKRPGVVELPSGLQYEVVTQGSGPKPGPQSMVTTHYAGTLTDGKKFDSSYDRGEPAQFPVNGVIRGWTEALQLMNEGSKWKLYIPSDLAYGDPGMPPNIGPGETLVFEVELIKVESGAPAQGGNQE